MKHENETKHIPVIFLTNEDFSIEGQKAGKELGMDAYLPKTERRQVILGKVNEVLKKYGHELPPEAEKEVEAPTN